MSSSLRPYDAWRILQSHFEAIWARENPWPDSWVRPLTKPPEDKETTDE